MRTNLFMTKLLTNLTDILKFKIISMYKGGFRGGGETGGRSPPFQSGPPPLFVETLMPIKYKFDQMTYFFTML